MTNPIDPTTREELLLVKRMASFWAAGAPVVVMAAGKIEKNHWWGECYVLIPKQFEIPPRAYLNLNFNATSDADTFAKSSVAAIRQTRFDRSSRIVMAS
jgi:hypothetical protein